MVNFRYNIVAAAIAFVAALAAVATVQQKFEADLVAQLTSSAPEVVGCDLCKDLCSSQQVCIYNKKMNTTRCLRSGIFTSNSLNKYERSGWEVCEYEDTDDDECPDPPPCAVPPENCKYVRPVYDDNKCLISCGEIICEGDDDDDDDDKCAPIKCADGREFPSCKDGYPLNYFVDPCRSLCGNGKCEEGEADEINPGGCGPDAPPECLGPPAYYKKGTCPQDCPSDCADDGKSVFKKPALGSTHCCSKNAGVKPPSLLEDNGLCSPPEDGSVGICVQDWWRTCGDGTCDRSEEDRCSCPKDCIEQECVKAGGKTPVVPDAPECCEGLKKISVAFPDDNTSEQMVDENNCIAAVGAVICSDCGNDKCEPWENGCNCKEDCGPCSGSCPSYAAPYCPDGDLIPTDEDECGCKLPSICCGDNKCGDREDTKICWKDCRADVCTSNSDCEKPFICSTSQGDCKPHPDCKLGGGCPDVCTGECVHPSADDDDDDNDDDDSDDDDNDDDDSDDDDDDDNDDDDDDIYSCALPADSQLDIATDDEYLYLVAWDQYGEENSKMEQYIYKIDGQCNVLERFSVPTEGGYLFGLSYGDGAFWASSGDSKHLVKLTKDFKVEKVFDLPYGAAQGVGYFRGKVYTVYNTAADEVTITDVDSGKTEFLFTAPANAPYGLAVEGETIWMGANGNIYALDENGKILHTIVSPTERGYISGLAILDEDNLFIVDNSDDRLYHMQLPHISDDVFVCCENTGKCKMLCDQGVCPSGMCENVPQECCRESGGCGPSCPSVGGNDNDDFECGDGVIDILEDCDDDNDESGDGCSQNCDVESGWSCTGEPSECEQEEAYDITLYGQLTDQLTGKPVSEAELLSAYEFEPSSVMSGKSGKFKFKVSTDFVLTEGVEEGQSDSGGMWSFFNKCYGYANLLVRRDQEGYDMSLGIHPFDMEERFKNISSMRSVNAGKVQMYPQADISIQTDTPVTFDVMFKYKNSDGYNGGGVGRLKTNHYLTAALPIDYDTFIQFTDEAGNTFNSSIYRIPREAHCGTVNLKYVNGQSQWSFCGNRVTEGGEECDDGNKVDGDGCSSECKKEVIAQSETVADDADGYRTFKTSGIGWTSIAGSGYKEQHYAHSPSRFALSKGKVYARWSLFNVEPGTYDLYTTWPSQGSDNVYFGAVEYTRTFGGKRIILKNQKVSQSQLPGGPVWNGVPWQKVGEVDLETGKLVRVYIASLQSEKFAADAVRLVKRGSGIGCLDIQEMEECWEGTSNETCYWDGEENLCSNERKPCHDLDDHEDHFYEPSITYGFEGVSDVSRDGHSDYCGTAGNEAGKLKEYYCKDDYNVGFILHTCPDGCQDGACVDGGDDDDDDDDSDDDDLRATLSIAGKAIGTGDTTVENEKNVNLLRFEARADDAHDILFTRAVFAADEGSLLNGQNYTLWVDTNKDGIVDTILEQGVASQSSKVMFDNLAGGGYIVPDGQTVVFEVHMDVSSSLTGNMIQLQFASGEANYVAAELLEDGSSLQGIETNGSCSVNTCDLLVRTTDSQPWTLVSQGDLYVSQSTIPLRNHQLLGGGLGEPIMRLKFRAQNEDVDVTDIQLTSVGNPISNEVDRLELYKDGESSPFAMATIGGCGSDDVPTTHEGKQVQTFCANTESRQLVVPEGEEIDVLVRSRIKTDVQGAVSGERIQFFVHGRNVSNNATGAGAIRARGDESSNNLSANDEDNKAEGEVFIGTDSVGPNSHITGKENVSVMSKITSITNANENPNGSAVPIGLSDIGKLKFTAASNTNSRNGLNAAEINGIIFNLNATNVLLNASPGNFRVYNPADSTITHNCKTFLNDSTREQVSGEVSGSLLIECKDLSPSAVDTNIYSGNSITLVLQGNVLDQNSSTVGAPSTLQVSLQNFESIERTDFGVENEQHMSHILWRDIDATSLTSFTWIEYPTTTVKSTSYAG